MRVTLGMRDDHVVPDANLYIDRRSKSFPANKEAACLQGLASHC